MHNNFKYTFLLLVLFVVQISSVLAANLFLTNTSENSDWNFYWGKFVTHQQVIDQSVIPDYQTDLPNYWTDIENVSNNVIGNGFGTYQKQFILNPNFKGAIGIRLEGVDVAYRAYVNNQLIHEIGSAADNKLLEIPTYDPTVIKFIPNSDTINILIQVSNFHHRRGGIWKKIHIDDYEIVQKKFARDELSDLMSLSILFSFGIFFILFYLYNKQEKSLHFFGLAFISIFIAGIATNFFPVLKFIDVAWDNLIRIEYIGHFFSLAFIIWAFHFVLPQRWQKIASILFTIVLASLSIYVLIQPVVIFSRTILIFYALLGIGIVITIIQFSIGLKSNRRISILVLSGIVALFIAAISDTFVSLGQNSISEIYILPKVFMFFILVLSIGFFKAYSNTYKKENSLRKELTDLNLSLEKTVQSRTKELVLNQEIIKSQNKTLKYDNLIKNKILSIIGHDLKSPIGSVLQDLELMDLIDDQALHKAGIENIKHSMESLFILVDNLLSWALNKEKRLKYLPEEVNIKEVIDNVISQITHIAKTKDIKIDNQVNEDKNVVCDISTTIILLRNILSNSIKFTPEKGRINIYSTFVKQHMKISICDSGIGITQEQIDLILNHDSFTSNKGTNNEIGTGLGLSLVKDFIKLNKGELSITSENGKGSCFSITLPLH